MSSLYGIALLPENTIEKQAISTSKKLSVFTNSFTLSETHNYPHLSLYTIELEEKDIQSVELEIKSIVKYYSTSILIAQKYYSVRGFLDIEYQKTDYLLAFQIEIITAINHLRCTISDIVREHIKQSSGIALDNFQNYGYKYVGDLFRPHMTLIKFENDQIGVEKLLPQVAEFNGVFNRIGLFEMGENGTCVRKIADFSLKA